MLYKRAKIAVKTKTLPILTSNGRIIIPKLQLNSNFSNLRGKRKLVRKMGYFEKFWSILWASCHKLYWEVLFLEQNSVFWSLELEILITVTAVCQNCCSWIRKYTARQFHRKGDIDILLCLMIHVVVQCYPWLEFLKKFDLFLFGSYFDISKSYWL